MQGAILTGNEDCLFLNVYTPPIDVIKKSGPLPVMVYFHGGGWSMGSGSSYFYGPQYILEHDVILVMGNYRLGPLGFISTETSEFPGNYGLKDQVEVLKWVQEHIKTFGGNPQSVTIFGESAGAGSVGHHLQSPQSKGLFHKAIQQSGTIFNMWAYPSPKGKASSNALKLAKVFNCDSEGENWTKIMDCLRKVDALELASKETEFVEWLNYPSCPFHPVIEPKHPEAFLDHLPRETGLTSLDIPVLMGLVADEGLLLSASMLNNEQFLTAFKDKVSEMFPLMFNFNHLSSATQKKISDEIEKFYFKNGHNYDKLNHRNLTDVSILKLINISAN